ncbi:Endophilin-A2 [Desmophyllum pertusum]|uniref:Endophilin-A2 n=1 Tax=Desmophyllum pertusum TaxID=174260 RepID=A0A9W9YTG3_9CNID|nr:Endophilin-A2 [Desmophyllum pertusum]
MSLAGFKKQINKANQFMSEKIGGAKGSRLDEDFMELERKTDVTANLVEHVSGKTKDYLQPNPGARAKLSLQSTVHKARGEAKVSRYPHPEGLLGETMQKGGQDLGEESLFGQALNDAGEAFSNLAEIKEALDTTVKQNFLDPLDQLRNRDIKEIMKETTGEDDLILTCKKRKGHKVPEEEIRQAEEKWNKFSQLAALAEAIFDYHKHCSDVMESLVATLNDKVSEAASRPRTERRSVRIQHDVDSDEEDSRSSYSMSPTPEAVSISSTPCCHQINTSVVALKHCMTLSQSTAASLEEKVRQQVRQRVSTAKEMEEVWIVIDNKTVQVSLLRRRRRDKIRSNETRLIRKDRHLAFD